MQASPTELFDAVLLALALPFVPAGLATLLPCAVGVGGIAGFLLF